MLLPASRFFRILKGEDLERICQRIERDNPEAAN
jgi:hypothetical protein